MLFNKQLKKILFFLFTYEFTFAIQNSALITSNQSQNKIVAEFIKNESIYKMDLGPQCAFKTLIDVQNAEKNLNDPDLNLSYEQFIQKVKNYGLLDKKLFHDPKNTEPQHEEKAINSILSWTNEYIKRDWIYNPQKCFLSAKEVFSLFYYTGEGYKLLNRAIRQNDNDTLQKFKIIGKHLNWALEKINPYNGFVKRIQNISFKNDSEIALFNEKYAIGNIITNESYTSTTIGYPTFEGNITYIIKTHTNCHYIADFSLVEQLDENGFPFLEEEEVLCKPYTKFKVIDHKIQNDTHKIYMEEVN